MSKLDIILNGRVKVITVKEVLEKNPSGAAGLGDMKIRDDEGKTHIISEVELSLQEFEKIRPGTEIHVRIQEDWVNMQVFESS